MPPQELLDDGMDIGQRVVVREIWKSSVAHAIDLPLSLLQDFRIDGNSEEERLYERYRLVHTHVSVLSSGKEP